MVTTQQASFAEEAQAAAQEQAEMAQRQAEAQSQTMNGEQEEGIEAKANWKKAVRASKRPWNEGGHGSIPK